MTYLEELNDSLSTDHHFVPFICNPTHLDFDKKIFDQSVKEHLSSIPKYQCRTCEDLLPDHITIRHLSYSWGCSGSSHELFLECIHGCCESCVDKISKGELDHTINRITYGDLINPN
jgi:hypothetical protein